MVRLAIRLDNPVATYRPGDTIQGFITLSIKRPFKTEAIELSIIGVAKTVIVEGDKHHERNPEGWTKYHEKSNCYAGYFYYFQKALNLQVLRCAKGELNLRQNSMLLGGTYECSFNYLLEWRPLAPSYKGTNGSIKYYCEAMIRCPWFVPNIRAKVKFTVRPVVDLNGMLSVKQPSMKTVEGKVGLRLLTMNREISATVILSKTGYVPGEEIPATVQIANNSSRPIVRMELRIVEHRRFIAFFKWREVCGLADPCLDGHVKDQKDIVGYLKESVHVEPHSQREYKRSIRVPEKAMMVDSCPIIQVGYALEVVIVTDGFFFKEVSDSLPLTVGTRPTASISVSGPVSTAVACPRCDLRSSFGDPPPSYPASEFGS